MKVVVWEVVATSTKSLDFYSKIDEVVADLKGFYLENLREGTCLKDKIDKMEKDLAERNDESDGGEVKRDFALATEQLDRLVDYLILTNGKLDDLREACKEVDNLMYSFLCLFPISL